jgi:hypothetical protein
MFIYCRGNRLRTTSPYTIVSAENAEEQRYENYVAIDPLLDDNGNAIRRPVQCTNQRRSAISSGVERGDGVLHESGSFTLCPGRKRYKATGSPEGVNGHWR